MRAAQSNQLLLMLSCKGFYATTILIMVHVWMWIFGHHVVCGILGLLTGGFWALLLQHFQQPFSHTENLDVACSLILTLTLAMLLFNSGRWQPQKQSLIFHSYCLLCFLVKVTKVSQPDVIFHHLELSKDYLYCSKLIQPVLALSV